jgi:hypothetical protein
VASELKRIAGEEVEAGGKESGVACAPPTSLHIGGGYLSQAHRHAPRPHLAYQGVQCRLVQAVHILHQISTLLAPLVLQNVSLTARSYQLQAE